MKLKEEHKRRKKDRDYYEAEAEADRLLDEALDHDGEEAHRLNIEGKMCIIKL